MSVEPSTTPRPVAAAPRIGAAPDAAPSDIGPRVPEPGRFRRVPPAWLHRSAHLLLLEELADWWHAHPSPFRLLDLSASADGFVQRLRQCPWPATVTTFDPWGSACNQAAPTRPHNRSITAFAAECLPFFDATFELVTCALAFHGFADQPAMVREMRRVLRRDGRLIIVDGFRDNLVGRFAFDLVMKRPAHGAGWVSWTVMRDHLGRAGFRRVRHRKSGVLLPLLATIGDVE